MSNIDLSIIIPCYNEPNNISDLIDKLSALTTHDKRSIEVIIVDGNSSDNTPQVIQDKLLAAPSCIKALYMSKRKGYGHDILAGLTVASGQTLAWTHADLQTDPQDVISAYDLFLKNNSSVIIKGQRQNRPLLDNLFTLGMQLVTFFILNKNIKDINAQPKLFSRNFYHKHLSSGAPNDFSLDLYLLYKAKVNNISIKSIPVIFNARINDQAKGGGGSWRNRLNLIKRTLKYIFHLRKLVLEK